MKNLVHAIRRFLAARKRPSPETSLRLLRERGESIASFNIRDAVPVDIPALAALHVKTWSETYPGARRPPGIQVREHQWREQFRSMDGSWFCLVVEGPGGKLVGFAKGMNYQHNDLPDYAGELNKIYLLRDYQRLGLGRRLLKDVARRFLDRGISSMVLFGTPDNPSCAFHEAMGGKRLYNRKGGFDGGYGWLDLRPLAADE